MPTREIVLDAAAPLIEAPRALGRHAPALRAGGVDAVLATVGSIEAPWTVVARLAEWQEYTRRPSAVAVVASSVAGIRAAKAQGKLAVVLDLQGLSSIGESLELLYLYRAAGVSVAQLTYNYANQLGSGCLETEDAGLTVLGRKALACAESLGIILDVTHTGIRTSLETIEAARQPVVASHSNAAAVCASPRNLTDEQIRAVAACGGVIGLCAFPTFVSEREPTIEHLVDHAQYIADLVGVRHVGIGFDFYEVDEDAFDFYRYDERYYPRPPWQWPLGIGGFADTQNFAVELRRRGFTDGETAGIMGENFLAVFRRVWGE